MLRKDSAQLLSPRHTKQFKAPSPRRRLSDKSPMCQTPTKLRDSACSTPLQRYASNPIRSGSLTQKSSLSSALSTPIKSSPKGSVTVRLSRGSDGSSAKKERVLILTPSAKKKSKQYDRFIPNRQTMDLASAQFNLKETPTVNARPLDVESLAYQKQIADACGLAFDKRILSFNVDPPPSERHDLRTSWNRPLKPPSSKLAKRRIPTVPEKVLDAPGMSDDFYLNVLDWSSKNILAVGLEQAVYLWNAETGSVQEFCRTADDDYVSSLKFTLDGTYLAVGTGSGDSQIWDVDSLSKVRSMRGHVSRVGVLSWNKHMLSSGSRDGSIWQHDVRIAKHKVSELIGHSSEVCGLAWRPDGNLLASGGNDNLVNIWDARTMTSMHVKSEHRAAVKALAWCPWQMNLLATGGGTSDQNIHFWNASSGAKLSTINAGSQVTSIIWSKQYKELLTSHGFPNNYLSIWSYPNLNKVVDLAAHGSRVLHTALSPDGQTVASAASDENLKFWKVFEKKATKSTATDVDDDLSKSYKRLTIR